MLRIHLAPAERRCGLDRHSWPIKGAPQTLIRSPIQGGTPHPLFYEIDTRELFVCVPHRYWPQYVWQPPESRVDLAHSILQFRRHA